MAQKNAEPSKAQKEFLKVHGIQPHLYTVVKELPNSMIVKHRITGEFKVIERRDRSPALW